MNCHQGSYALGVWTFWDFGLWLDNIFLQYDIVWPIIRHIKYKSIDILCTLNSNSKLYFWYLVKNVFLVRSNVNYLGEGWLPHGWPDVLPGRPHDALQHRPVLRGHGGRDPRPGWRHRPWLLHRDVPWPGGPGALPDGGGHHEPVPDTRYEL